jgi:hypothetical protein
LQAAELLGGGGAVGAGIFTDTVPSRATVIDCAVIGMVMAGCSTKPSDVTIWPLLSRWNEPSRV